MIIKFRSLTLLLFVFCIPAMAQWGGLKQKGKVVDGNLLAWEKNGIVKDSGFSSTNIIVTYSGLLPYVYDPVILQTQITANAEAIDNIDFSSATGFVDTVIIGGITNAPDEDGVLDITSNLTAYAITMSELFGSASYFIPSTTNTLVNGTNLWDAVVDYNGSGSTNYYILTPGSYEIPSTLVISGQVATIAATIHSPLQWTLPFDYSNPSSVPSAPINPPSVTVTGDAYIDSSALGSGLIGLEITGTFEAPQSAYTDIESSDPTSLINCWIGGNALTNDSSIFVSGCFFGGQLSPANAAWAGQLEDSIVLGNGSLYKPSGGWGKASVEAFRKVKGCWISGSGSLGLAGNTTKWYIKDSLINGSDVFADNGGDGYVNASGAKFYSSSTWDGLLTSSYFYRCDGILTSITGTVTKVLWCSGSNSYNPLDNK